MPLDRPSLTPLAGDPPSSAPGGVCRSVGCVAASGSRLGFCAACLRAYRGRAQDRAALALALRRLLDRAGDPVLHAFGPEHRDALAAHALGHLDERAGVQPHVPAEAVRDFVAEIDARADEEALHGPR